MSDARRLAGLSSGGSAGGCDGALDVHLSQAFLAANGVSAGTTLYVQLWYADPGHPDGSGVGHTDALRFTVCQ